MLTTVIICSLKTNYFKNMEGVLTVESAALKYSVLDLNCAGIAVIGGSEWGFAFHPPLTHFKYN